MASIYHVLIVGISEALTETGIILLSFIFPKIMIWKNISYKYLVDFKFFWSEVQIASVNRRFWSINLSFSFRQSEMLASTTATLTVYIGITRYANFYRATTTEYCAKFLDTVNTASNASIFHTLINAEQECRAILLVFVYIWIVLWIPFCCCEPTKDEIFCCLDYSDSPSFFITTSMEILTAPTVSAGIINSLEPSPRILVPNKL